MRLSFPPQFRVMRPAASIAHRRYAGPVIERISKSVIATSSHDHNFLATALPRDGSDACVRAQRSIVAISDGLRSFSQQRGRHDPPDSRQRSKNRDIGRLRPSPSLLIAFGARIGELIENGLDSGGDV